jgi:hypothetical protein
LSPHAWLDRQPLQPSEQLFAIFSNASSAEPLEAWKRLAPAAKASPIWADTAYAEWQAVMPFVATVAVDSEFVQWVATTESRDWGWLAVSSASQDALVEHLRSLTQVLLPDGRAVFFRFWDGRHVLPVLQSAEVCPVDLLPVIGRCLINGRTLDVGGSALKTSKVFPWWEVSDALLKILGAEEPSTRINNLLQWLSEEQPDIFEAFSERVLRSKVAHFVATMDVSSVPKANLLEYLEEERR